MTAVGRECVWCGGAASPFRTQHPPAALTHPVRRCSAPHSAALRSTRGKSSPSKHPTERRNPWPNLSDTQNHWAEGAEGAEGAGLLTPNAYHGGKGRETAPSAPCELNPQLADPLSLSNFLAAGKFVCPVSRRRLANIDC